MSLKTFINYEYILSPKDLKNHNDNHNDGNYIGFLIRSIKSLNGLKTKNFVINIKLLNEKIFVLRIKRKYQKGSNKSSILVINLNKNVISVSKSNDFLNSDILLKVIIVLLSKKLSKNGLKIETRKLKVVKDFWELIYGKEDRIKELHFEYISSNLKGSKRAITTKIRMLFEMLGDNTNKISMIAPRGKTLKNISKFNKILNPLVAFSRSSNSNIRIKFIDENKYFNTSKNSSVTIFENFNFDKIGKEEYSNYNLEIHS
ncbi:MAG: hypothetical protein ACE364_12555 [Chlorobiota bacterium]